MKYAKEDSSFMKSSKKVVEDGYEGSEVSDLEVLLKIAVDAS